MSIATADLAAQTTETLLAELATTRHSMRRNRVIDLLAERGAIEAPAAYADLIVDDIITYGSRKSEWAVIEKVSPTMIYVRQIKGYRDPRNVGQGALLVEGETRVWRVL
jgi:hypothetical protein